MFSNNQATTDNSYRSGFGGHRGCGNGFGRRFGGKAEWLKHFAGMGGNRIPVNIEDGDEAYTMYVYAPGLSKEAIKLSVKKSILTIAYTAPETKETADKFSHREYYSTSFERAFQINDEVLTDQIVAAYADGILKVTLPKNPESNIPAKEVNVS